MSGPAGRRGDGGGRRGACFDFRLSLRRGAQPLCCLDNRANDEKGAPIKVPAWQIESDRGEEIQTDGGLMEEPLEGEWNHPKTEVKYANGHTCTGGRIRCHNSGF